MKLTTLALAAAMTLPMVAACSDADVASANLSKAAEEFEIVRRTVFYNGITGDYILNVEGACSVESPGDTLYITCKLGEKQYVKHFLGLSDNVTWFSEQIETANVSTYHYRVIFKPDVILPAVELDSQVTGGN